MQEPRKQNLQGTKPTLWAEDWGGRWLKEETLRCPLSSLPKRGSQDPNFSFTLSSCDQSIKRYQSTARNKYAFNSCVRGLGCKDLALNTSHQDTQKPVIPTSSKTSWWTSSRSSLTVNWKRRMGLCPYSPVLEVNQCCVSNLCSWLP